MELIADRPQPAQVHRPQARALVDPVDQPVPEVVRGAVLTVAEQHVAVLGVIVGDPVVQDPARRVVVPAPGQVLVPGDELPLTVAVRVPVLCPPIVILALNYSIKSSL